MAIRTTAQEAREMMELKKKAMEFYKDNGVPQKMEEILNSTFYDKPDDVYGHLANYFGGFAAVPKITKVVSREALDGKGQSAVQTDVYCRVKNHQKLISSSLSANGDWTPDNTKPETPEEAEVCRQKSVTEAVRLIESQLQERLTDLDPTQQTDIDTVLINTLEKLKSDEAEQSATTKDGEGGGTEEGDGEPIKSSRSSESKSKLAKSPKGKGKGPAVVVIPDEPREGLFCGCPFVSALSQSVAQAGAAIKGEPLYNHIASVRYDEVPEKFRLPLPMVTILMSGKLAPGKLNAVKEFMVVPKPGMPVRESIKHIVNIYNHCAKTLSAKIGITGKAVNDLGALWATFDRVEQGLELLQDAISQQGLTPGEDFHIAVNCAGHETFDYEKGKYEVVTGQLKSGEDLSDYWGDIITRYTSIIALIDPLRKVEMDAWMRLAERVSEHCYVVGDVVYPRPGVLKDMELRPDFRTSAVIMRLEQMNTVSDVISAVKKLDDADNQIIVSSGLGDSPDSFIVDLAVGCGAQFLKVGAPCRGERVAKLNRLLQIEALLECEDKLVTPEAHVFPVIKPPTPPPPPEDDTEGAENKEAKKD